MGREGIPALLHCAQIPGSPVAWRAASALANLAEFPELVPTLQEASGFFYQLLASWEVKLGVIAFVGLKKGS